MSIFQNKWNIKSIILVSLIGFMCSIISLIFNLFYDALLLILTSIGFAPFANELLFGLFTIAGALAAFVIRAPGSSILGDMTAAILEMLMGGQFGAVTLIEGLIQGVSTETGFALKRYRNYDVKTLLFVCLTTSVITFSYDIFKENYLNYPFIYILLLFLTRTISVLIFTGFPVWSANKLINKSNIVGD